MEKSEIKQIADYLKDLEEGLVEWDYRGVTMQRHFTKLYVIIERMMEAKTRIVPLIGDGSGLFTPRASSFYRVGINK